MAYSLGDPYRPLRAVLRLNGILLGLVPGALLGLGSRGLLASAGLYSDGSTFALRLAGALLFAFGLWMLLASGARAMESAVLVPCFAAHTLLALTLLTGYLRGELDALGPIGVVALIVAFALCIGGALAPLRYFRAEYRF